MKILILDQLGCYASVVAASYLTGLINEAPTTDEIYNLPFFAAHLDLQVGKVYYIGKDKDENGVYCLGAGKEARLVKTSSNDLFKIIRSPNEVCLIEVSSMNGKLLQLIWTVSLWKIIQKKTRFVAAMLMSRKVKTIIDKVNSEIIHISGQRDCQDCLDAPDGITHN